MKGLLKRNTYSEKQTLGALTVRDQKGIVFKCCTLELPWRDNKRNISCIPSGTYRAAPRFSEKFKWHYHITGVTGRDFILIHPGNFYFQIRGCVLVGEDFGDINSDGIQDVVNSRKTFDKLLRLAPEGFDLEIQ